MLKMKSGFLSILAFVGFFMLPALPAKADLTIAPLRVVFEGRDRSAVVSLVNLAPYVNTYRLGWTLYGVDEKGGYTTLKIDENDPFSVDKMVIFSPRQVVINPEEHQLVRLSLRRPPNLPPGEYRGHLTFTRLQPDVTRKTKHREGEERPKGQNIALNVNVSFSIPVIVRNGTDDSLRVALENPKFEQAVQPDGTFRPVLKMNLERLSGRFSTYGAILVFWKKPGAKEEEKVGVLNNLALYPEVKSREVEVSLLRDDIAGGEIRVVYQGKYESAGTIWAEKTFPVGQ